MITPEEKREKQRIYDSRRPKGDRHRPGTNHKYYLRKKQDPLWVKRNWETELKRKTEVRKFLKQYKLNIGCKDCGYKKHHVALDFDHVRGVKKYSVCNSKSIKKAKEEIEKCEVVCANCHRIRTYNRLKSTDIF